MDKKLKLDYVIFPMGFTFDKDFIYLSYGRNDIAGGVLKLDREKLLRSLLPVETHVLGYSKWDAKTSTVEAGSYLINTTARDIYRVRKSSSSSTTKEIKDRRSRDDRPAEPFEIPKNQPKF
jgi:hypothetical protein